MLRTNFALAVTIAVVLGSEIQQTPVDLEQLYETDVGLSTKLIGRLSWQSTFDNWVTARMPLGVDPDEHVCGYTFQFGKITQMPTDNREALHVSHNCSADLIKQVRFEFVMQDPGEMQVLYDKNQNWNCHTQDGTNMTCTVVLTAPKVNSADETGNNAAIWLPAPFSTNTLDWSYQVTFYEYWKEAPQDSSGVTSGGSGTNPEDDVNGGMTVQPDDETFTTPSEGVTPLCSAADVQAQVVAASAISINLEDYVWGCTLYESDFYNGGFYSAGVSQIKYTRLNDEHVTDYIIAMEVSVTNGLEEKRTRFSPLGGTFLNNQSWDDKAWDMGIYHDSATNVLRVDDVSSFSIQGGQDVYTETRVNYNDATFYNFGESDVDGFSMSSDYAICGWYWAYEKTTNRLASFAPKICQ